MHAKKVLIGMLALSLLISGHASASNDPVAPDPNAGTNFNRYSYANNNPYRFTDPDGRQAADLRATAAMAERANRDVAEVRQAEMAAVSGSGPTALDALPGIGDVKGVVDAIQDPTPANIAGAAVGLVPGGDLAKGVIKNGGRIGDFTRAQKNAAKAENAAQNGGKMACTDCGKNVESIASQKGVPTPDNQAQIHHDPAIKDGGGQHSKPVVLCPECHKGRHGSGQ